MIEGINYLIERHKLDHEFETYIEAITDFAEHHEIEVEEIVDIMDPILKEKVKIEFIKRNYFPDKKIECTLDDFMNDES